MRVADADAPCPAGGLPHRGQVAAEVEQGIADAVAGQPVERPVEGHAFGIGAEVDLQVAPRAGDDVAADAQALQARPLRAQRAIASASGRAPGRSTSS